MHNPIDELAELFQEFPGIGRRQARRFVYFLLHKNNHYKEKLVKNILKVREEVQQCRECYRFYPQNGKDICPICESTQSAQQIMLVEKDADLENLHKTGLYQGKYFVLGGFISGNEKKKSYARIDELFLLLEREEKKGGLKEIIFGLSVSPEAEHTRIRLSQMIREKYPKIILSTLGRGLSTGTELEYSDTETLKYALQSRIVDEER